MQRQPLESRAVVSAGYDADAQVLELEFRSGRVYRYENVPGSVYGWLLRTRNKGGFVSRMVSGRYPERALPDARPRDVRAAGQGGAPARELPGGDEEDAALEQLLRASVALLSDALQFESRPADARQAEARLAPSSLPKAEASKAER